MKCSLGISDFLEENSAAATAKSLQLCPTLCDLVDISPPGSPAPGILQARTLEWVAISFSNAGKWKVKVKSLSHVRLSMTPWTTAYQAPPSIGFSQQEYWSGVPLLSPWREISSFLFCFPLFLYTDHWGRLSYLSLLIFATVPSNGYIFPFLLCLLLLFFSQLFVRLPQTIILPFCISFPLGWSWSLPPMQCHEPLSIVLQALCHSNLIPWIYLSLPLDNHKGFDFDHTWMV